MRQNKDLLDEVTINFLIQIICIIQTDFDHFSYQCTYDKKRTAIHAGNRVINNDYLVFHFFITEASPYKVIEIQEGYEVTLTLR